MEEVVAQLSRDLIAVAGELDAAKASVSTSFMEVVRHVEHQVFDPLVGAKTVAAEFGMSVSNFSHQFKKCTGQTFSEFVLERRLRKAKELLERTDSSLSDIVQETGFGNVSSFIRRFRRVTGCTPIDYRRYARIHRTV
jgi:AraC-like DNA-binding protein